ncbi:MAG: hypothetical protein ABIO70_18655 [Pseudomonadota bacterium]
MPLAPASLVLSEAALGSPIQCDRDTRLRLAESFGAAFDLGSKAELRCTDAPPPDGG